MIYVSPAMTKALFDGNMSYLFGDDARSGWGPRYFFTFYTELGNREWSSMVESTIFICIFIPSIVANIAIAAAVLKYTEMRTVANCFLLNLTVADLLFASGIPALIYSRLTSEWKLGVLLCKLLPYSQFVCGFVLLWTLTWISMDRYRCIVVPPFRSQLTTERATVLTCVTWLVGSVIFLPVAFWFRTEEVAGRTTICTLVFPRNDAVSVSLLFTVPTLLLSCVTPLSLFVYHYQRIFCQLKTLRPRWKAGAANASSAQTTKQTVNCRQQQHQQQQQDEVRFNRHLRIMHILLINVLTVLIMWLPITVMMLLIYIDGHRPNEDTNFFLRSHHFIYALQVALSNTVVNPILYGVLSENFRKRFLRMWFLSQKRRALTKCVYSGTVAATCSHDCKKDVFGRFVLAQMVTNSASLPEGRTSLPL